MRETSTTLAPICPPLPTAAVEPVTQELPDTVHYFSAPGGDASSSKAPRTREAQAMITRAPGYTSDRSNGEWKGPALKYNQGQLRQEKPKTYSIAPPKKGLSFLSH